MKKTKKISLILISLLGAILIGWKLFPQNNPAYPLPILPPNLGSEISPNKIYLPVPVPILMYHHVQEIPGGKNKTGVSMVTPENLEKQLQWLLDHNFQTVNFDYLYNPLKSEKKPIILTFDDGYRDAYEKAFPVLKKYKSTGTFFPIVNNIDKSGFVTQKQLLEMKRAGMGFGSHSLSHPNLTTSSDQKNGDEIYGSKNVLEQRLGITISDFCYPSGIFDQRTVNFITNSGYKTAVTVNNGTNFGTIDPFRLNRINIENETNFDNIPELQSKINSTQ
jgi:peptidoglycan/xylan/chitin deacetylase (PgdA/CDA1 family)